MCTDHESALELSLEYRNASLQRIFSDMINGGILKMNDSLNENTLCFWSKINTNWISHHQHKEQKEKEINYNFLRLLQDIIKLSPQELQDQIIKSVINKIGSILDPIQEFTKWLTKYPHLIPSLYLPYLIQHNMHRDKNMSWRSSHFQDLDHLSAIPYVNYITADAQMYNYSIQAFKSIKEISSLWKNKIIKSPIQIK